jgi:hypothetical protein
MRKFLFSASALVSLSIPGLAHASCGVAGTQWSNGGLVALGGNCGPNPSLGSVVIQPSGTATINSTTGSVTLSSGTNGLSVSCSGSATACYETLLGAAAAPTVGLKLGANISGLYGTLSTASNGDLTWAPTAGSPTVLDHTGKGSFTALRDSALSAGLAGADASGNFLNITPGTGCTLSGTTLNCPGTGVANIAAGSGLSSSSSGGTTTFSVVFGTTSGTVLDAGLAATTYETLSSAALLAPRASPAFTGTPVAPTQTTGDSSTDIATDAFVKNQSYLALTGNSSGTTVQPSWATIPLSLGQVLTDGVNYDIRQFGAAFNGCISGTPHDDYAAVAAATAQANSDWTSLGVVDNIRIPPGCLLTSLGFNFASGVPAHVIGAGADVSRIVWATSSTGTAFSGDTISFDNAFGGASTAPTNNTIPTLNTYTTGGSVADLTIVGNRTLTGNGIMYYDADDHVWVHHVVVQYVPGCAICGGLTKTSTNGVTREGFWLDNRIEDSGGGTAALGTAQWPSIGLFSQCAGTYCLAGGSSNAMDISDNRIYASFGPGMEFCTNNVANSIHNITIARNQIEQNPSTSTTGDNLDIGGPTCQGEVAYVFGTDNQLNIPEPGYWGLSISGTQSGTYTCASHGNAPADISLLNTKIDRGGTTGGGTKIDCGWGINLEYVDSNIIAPQTALQVGSLVSGAIRIDPGPNTDSNWGTITDAAPAGDLIIRDDSVYGHATMGTLTLGGTSYTTLPVAPVTTSGTYTPTVTPFTLVTWAPNYSSQKGYYTTTVIGAYTQVCMGFSVVFAPTFSTDSGVLEFSLPGADTANTLGAFPMTALTAITWPASDTYVNFVPQPSKTYALLAFGKSTVVYPGNYLLVSSLTSGSTYTVAGGGCYLE